MTPRSQRKEFYSERSHEELVNDAMEAFIRIEKAELKIWILAGALVGAVGLNGWLATSLFECVKMAVLAKQ